MPVFYNYSRYGCPGNVYFGALYQPMVYLYDGAQNLRQVDADFIIYEVNGRFDYEYNVTLQNNVLNSQNFSAIKWNGEGMFVFNVEVVDRNYSYCYYKTSFAVFVYGQPLNVWYGIAIVLSFTFGVFLALVVSYFIYRRRQKKLL
eukprot:Colp12_sorted_trinity150504_noHs@17729